jgi:Mrp family chromosome partitioning ATPase
MGVPLEAVEGLARALGGAGESARRIAVVGERRNMGTTLAAITLARALARQSRVVLVDLALDSPNLSAIASDSSAPGIAELVQGSVSFGQIITRDKYSRIHVITAGRAGLDSASIMSSSRLAITLEALARSYDHVVVDAGSLPDLSAERLAQLAPRAVLVANELAGPVTDAARDRLLAAGFPNVSVLASASDGPEFDAGRRRAAA